MAKLFSDQVAAEDVAPRSLLSQRAPSQIERMGNPAVRDGWWSCLGVDLPVVGKG